jgi:hypothetical protein
MPEKANAMRWLGTLAAAALIIVVLIDAFEVVLLPRRVRHGYRLARVFYQAFSRRENGILLLDARAGSPPSAGELLRRLAEGRGPVAPFQIEWERWAAELLESHLSFPVLGFYRSQHENESWVGALTAILDTSALLIAGIDGPDGYQARLTFAMGRHAAVDLTLVFQRPPLPPPANRLPEAQFERLRESLRRAGVTMRDGPAVAAALEQLRGLYEPFVNALAAYFQFALPPFQPERPPVDNWQTSPGMPRSPGLSGLSATVGADSHFDRSRYQWCNING